MCKGCTWNKEADATVPPDEVICLFPSLKLVFEHALKTALSYFKDSTYLAKISASALDN